MTLTCTVYLLFTTQQNMWVCSSVLLLEHDQSKVLTLLFISISQKRLELDYMHCLSSVAILKNVHSNGGVSKVLKRGNFDVYMYCTDTVCILYGKDSEHICKRYLYRVLYRAVPPTQSMNDFALFRKGMFLPFFKWLSVRSKMIGTLDKDEQNTLNNAHFELYCLLQRNLT